VTTHVAGDRRGEVMSTLRGSHSHPRHAYPLLLLALLLVSVLALAACGGETASGTTKPAASPSPAVSNGETTAGTSPPAASPRPAVASTKHESIPWTYRGMGLGKVAETFGWKFSPTVDIEVTKLGCYDAGRDGLARPHRVGIFDAGSGRLLASVTVRPKSTLGGFFRWESLKTPLVLKAGRSYLAGTEDKKTLETLYLPNDEFLDTEPAEEVGFDRIHHNRPSEGAFTAPMVPQNPQRYPFVLSPNFMFVPVSTSSPTATRSGASSGPGEPGRLVWKFETGAAVHSTPAVSRGVVFVGNDDGHLYAVDIRSGRQRWEFTTGGTIRSALAVADGAVYCRSADGYLHAVDVKSGQERWKFAAGDMVRSSPAVGGGRVYLAVPRTSEPHWDDLYALDGASGRVVWRAGVSWKETPENTRDDNDTVTSSPAVSDGVVYYSPWDILHALDGKTGERLRKSDHIGLPIGTPAVAHGLLYTRLLDNWPFTRVDAVDAMSGKRQWVSRMFSQEVSARCTPPAVGGELVYVTRGDGTLFALDGQSGRERWRSAKGVAGEATPAVGDGVVCVGNDQGWLDALNADTGRQAWKFSTGDGWLSSPVISHGVVYVGSDDGSLYAVKR
jgi:eukaryotic-like serine/threonine-protein kinase